MQRGNGAAQHGGEGMLATPADDNQVQPTLNHQHLSHDAGITKPLICSYFKRPGGVPSPYAGAAHNIRNSVNSRPLNGTASPMRVGEASSSLPATPPTHHPRYPPPMEEAIHLFPLTPSVKVPLSHSRRSGRVLNESETLQEKHAQEYRFIVPALAYAIECTIAEHERIRQSAGLPAHVSPSASPPASPTQPSRTTGEGGSDGGSDSGSDGTAGAGRQRVGSLDSGASAEERNSAAGYRVFQAAISSFSTREVPAISVHDYLKRIVKYTYVSPAVLVCCCLYLDRLLAMYPSLLLHPNNIFKFLITSTRVCSKIMDTRTLNNRDFSVVGGVTNEDINALEFMFVQLLQNRLYISHHTFDVYCEPLRRQAAHVDVEGEWDGTTLAMVLPVNGGRPGSYPHQPARPSLARNSAGGSVASRSRRSSIMSQNEYSLSMASQSGVSPLRSASRPAFPPSASLGQSISVDGEFLTTARQSSAAPSRAESAATSGRRYMMGPMGGSSSTRSPVLPQVHAPTAAPNAATAAAVPVIRNATSAATLRSSGNSEDAAATPAFSHTEAGVYIAQLQHQQAMAAAASAAVDDNGIDDARARSIPVSGTRGFASSWDTARAARQMAAAAGGPSSTALGSARAGSPNILHQGSGTGLGKSRSMDGVAASAEEGVTFSSSAAGIHNGSHNYSGERTPTRRAYASTARGDNVALPPVPVSGRRGRSGSSAGNAGGPAATVPPPPDFRSR